MKCGNIFLRTLFIGIFWRTQINELLIYFVLQRLLLSNGTIKTSSTTPEKQSSLLTLPAQNLLKSPKITLSNPKLSKDDCLKTLKITSISERLLLKSSQVTQSDDDYKSQSIT